MKILTFLTLLIGLIPAPRSFTPENGFFIYKDGTEPKVIVNPKRYASKTLPYGSKVDESYTLEVTANGITIKAATREGAFYASQTLAQLKDLYGENIPCCKIEDAPYLGYRGLLLDVSRHFLCVDYILHTLDAMAYLKMNRLHLHLTDNPGWRLLLDSHPELALKTAFRKDAVLMNTRNFIPVPRDYVPGTLRIEKGCYGGYFSKDNIREIISYAADRGIEVIPEIDIPGHSEEVLYTYPELQCKSPVIKSNRDLCPGKEETFRLFEEILAEVMELFPSEYIHIGGDEAAKSNWSTCPDCQALMKAEGLEEIDALQSFFIRRIEKFVLSKGKKIIGWDEILDGGVTKSATLMLWRADSEARAVAAMKAGNDMINSVNAKSYLNYSQGPTYLDPISQAGYVSLETAYNFKPEAEKHLIGVQCAVWGEWVTTEKHCDYMLYPRLFAIAERGWASRENQTEFSEWRPKAVELLKVFKAKGYNAYDIENEKSPTPANYEPVSHLAVGAKVTVNGKAASAVLTDSYPGTLSGGWEYYRNRTEFVVDLGKANDLRFIGVSFQERRNVSFPESVEVLVSEDGTNYKSLGIKALQINANTFSLQEMNEPDFDPTGTPTAMDSQFGNLSWAAVPVNFFCNLKGIRHVKYIVIPGPKRIGLDEFIIF